MAHEAAGTEVKGGPSTLVRSYTFCVTALSGALLVKLMSHPALAFDDVKQIVSFGPAKVAVLTLGLMSLGGALGGCLYSLRKLGIHAAARDYSSCHDWSYYVRPLSSAISGLMVCLLLLGGALTLTTGSGDKAGWLTFSGRMPYLAFSLLAGYSGHKFTQKLSGLADYIFAVDQRSAGSSGNAPRRTTSARRLSTVETVPPASAFRRPAA